MRVPFALAIGLTACTGDDITFAPGDGGDATVSDVVIHPEASLDAALDASVDAIADATVDTGQDAASDAGPDSDAAPPVNDCTSFVDRTGQNDSREIDFPMDALPAQYSPPCMLILAGQTVTYVGAFTDHPLEAAGGDANNPIPPTSSGTSTPVLFANAGTFGFHCAFHPGIMFGAVVAQ